MSVNVMNGLHEKCQSRWEGQERRNNSNLEQVWQRSDEMREARPIRHVQNTADSYYVTWKIGVRIIERCENQN